MIVALLCGQPDGKHFPGRNLIQLLGRPMMVYPLLAALNAKQVDKVFLSTDAPAMARVGKHQGAEILDRPGHLQGSEVPLEAIVADAYQQIVGTLGCQLDCLVVLLCNSPTVTADMIDGGIDVLLADRSADAVVSVSLHDEFHPRRALKLGAENRLTAFQTSHSDQMSAFFADALLWVLRPASYFESSPPVERWLIDLRGRQVAPLTHEGYGDIDYPWQIAAVEDWLRRRGFSEELSPYTATSSAPSPDLPYVAQPPSTAAERRVLITTVPFGHPVRRPLELLDQHGVEYLINPVGRRLKEDELAELARDFGILIAGTEPITRRVIDAAPHLRLISRVGIGLDNVDLLAARDREISVSYTPDAPSPAVAELALGLMINLARHVTIADRGIRNSVWARLMGRRLAGSTLGVIGVGRVGKRLIRLVRGAFPDLRILANDLALDLEFGYECQADWVDKDTIYREADIISLHLPLTSLTRRMIAEPQLALMKPTTLLINTARGGLIDEHELAEALRANQIGGAAIDVFEHEPYAGELITVANCILTSHLGSMSEDCRAQMELEATEEALRYIRGEALRQTVPESEYLNCTAFA